jgi:hypothetical protein
MISLQHRTIENRPCTLDPAELTIDARADSMHGDTRAHKISSAHAFLPCGDVATAALVGKSHSNTVRDTNMLHSMLSSSWEAR